MSPAQVTKTAKKVAVRAQVTRSPIGEKFKQISSQVQDSGSASSAKASAEANASAEPELTEAELEALMNDPVAGML